MLTVGDPYVMAGHRAGHQWRQVAKTDGRDKPGHDLGP
jgi:hypothetical protein